MEEVDIWVIIHHTQATAVFVPINRSRWWLYHNQAFLGINWSSIYVVRLLASLGAYIYTSKYLQKQYQEKT
jgi:hypothetical protein